MTNREQFDHPIRPAMESESVTPLAARLARA
jgi:hypothetical protein